MNRPIFPDPQNYSLDDFLAGPDACNKITIDDCFAKDIATWIDDCLPRGASEFCRIDEMVTRSIMDPSIIFVPIETGLLAIEEATGRLIGGYAGVDLVIDRAWRGQGLGAETVLEYFLRNDELPNWWAEKPAYTRAGFRAHERAWEMALDAVIMAAKHESLFEPAEPVQFNRPIVFPRVAVQTYRPRQRYVGATAGMSH